MATLYVAAFWLGLPLALRYRQWSIALVLAGWLGYTWWHSPGQPEVDFNTHPNPTELAGVWRDDAGRTLVIRVDGQPAPGSPAYVAVQTDGHLALILDWPGDPDAWDGTLAYRITPAAPPR